MDVGVAVCAADEVEGFFFDGHDGWVRDGEVFFYAATVAFNDKGVGAVVGTEAGEDRVAFDTVPEVACIVGGCGGYDGNGLSVVASRAGGGNGEEGVKQVEEYDVEGVGFATSVKGGDE